MSSQSHPPTGWQLCFFAAALLLSCGGLYSAPGQIPDTSLSTPYHPPSPQTSIKHVASKHPDNRSKQPSSHLPKPSPDIRKDDKPQAIEQTLTEGNEAREKNEYEQAFAHYRKVAQELNPKEARAFYGMGALYSDLYCNDSAIEAYRNALELKKDYLEARTGLGYAYINKERYDDAEKQFHEALNLKPNNVGANIGLGIAYAKNSKYQEAFRQINLIINDKSINDKDRAAAYVALGEIYQAQNKWQEAIAPYEKATNLNPDLADAYLKLGMAQLVSAFARFSSLALQEVRTQDMEGLSASARQAGENIQRAIVEHHYNHPNAYIIQGYALMYQSNYQGAAARFNTYLAKVKEIEDRLSSIATNITTKCDYGFSRLYADGHWFLGFMYAREASLENDNQRKTQLYNEAIKQLEEAIKIKQDYANAYSTLGATYLQQGKYEEAVERYQKELLYETKDFSKATAYSMLGITYYQMGRYSEAIDSLKKAIELNPNIPSAHSGLSIIYGSQGNFDEAIAQQKMEIELEPQPTAHSYYFLAAAYFSRARKKGNEEDYAEAIRLSKKALEINNAYASAYLLLGHLYKFSKAGAMADEALDNYNKAKEYEPKNPVIYLGIGDLYYAVKHNDEAAIENLTKAIELKPDYVLGYWELASLYHHKKDDAEAIKQLLNAIKYDPKYLDAYFLLAAIYKDQKNYPEAIKHLKTATNLAYKDFYPYKELAKIYEAQQNIEDAVHYYEEAINRLNADDSSTKNLYLGRIARLKGQYAEAIEYFRKVSFPDEPGQPYFEIGVLYIASKNKRAALEQYQQLVQLKSPLADELLKKINEMK